MRSVLHGEMLAQVGRAHLLIVKELGRFPFRENSAIAHYICTVADIEGLPHIMVGNQNADTALPKVTDDALDIDNGERIDSREGLVEQNELRLHSEAAGDFQAASLAPGQTGCVIVAQLSDPELGQELMAQL